LTIVLSVCRYTVDDYLFGIFKPCLTFYYHIADYRVVMILIMMITAFLCLLSTINANPGGAPPGACQNMMPQHGPGVVTQPGDAPYNIAVAPMLYSSGTTVTGKSIMQIEIL
jgi:hypothetical protein